jgi:Family of unknown function (DUF6526)
VSEPVQTYKNHRRFAPVFHGVVLPVFTLNIGWAAWRLWHGLTVNKGVNLLVALALLLGALASRVFSIRVQDRVIRLEMRLRLARLAPEDLRARIDEFSVDQLVALRFASDAELPALANRVLADRMHDRDAIKKMIEQWQPDLLRV